jgi:hypothetical protein
VSGPVDEFALHFEEALRDENGQQRPFREAICVALELSEDRLDSNILAEVVALRLTAERCDRQADESDEGVVIVKSRQQLLSDDEIAQQLIGGDELPKRKHTDGGEILRHVAQHACQPPCADKFNLGAGTVWRCSCGFRWHLRRSGTAQYRVWRLRSWPWPR